MTQEQALDILKMGHNVFLTGAPGTGKTYVISQYIKYLEQHGITCTVTASTGIAATHIGGVTIHSWSGMGARESLSAWDIEMMLEKKHIWNRFQSTHVLIIDEISMISAKFFESLDRLAKTMRRSYEPFGGMQIVCVGDFFQLPPITDEKKENKMIFAFQSSAWQEADMHVCYLEKNYRQSSDTTMMRLLDALRSQHDREEIEDMLRDCQEQHFDDQENFTRLFTHVEDVDSINFQQLSLLDGETHEYVAVQIGNEQHVATLQKSLLAPEVLFLKQHAFVMFVKNNPEQGYVNGTLGKVVECGDDSVTVQTYHGDIIEVFPESWVLSKDDGKKLAEIKQLPLRLAWAFTIHKSQGMTLDAAEIDLSKCFVPGQGYVALSRVRNRDGLKIMGYNDMALTLHPQVVRADRHMKQASEKLINRLVITNHDAKNERHKEFIKRTGGQLHPIKKRTTTRKFGYRKTKKK